jgi:predicted RNA-binding protein with PUA-like domain
MTFWLMKSEPDVFSLDDLRRRGIANWDGVRNYQARGFLRAMKKGDRAFFYHSSTSPAAIVGVIEVVREAYPDATQFDRANDGYDPRSTKEAPRWDQVDVKFVEALQRSVTLDEIRGVPELQSMVLVKNSRLSVQPVSDFEWDTVMSRSRMSGLAKVQGE